MSVEWVNFVQLAVWKIPKMHLLVTIAAHPSEQVMIKPGPVISAGVLTLSGQIPASFVEPRYKRLKTLK